ncbi:MAG TPA: hypothetical protein VGF79_11470 [Bacteroidia bacterium]
MSARSQLWLGLGMGLFTAFIVSLVVFLRTNPGLSASDYFNFFVYSKLLSGILSVSLIANLALFYLFLKFDKDQISKGVLAATVIVGILIFIMKFFL